MKYEIEAVSSGSLTAARDGLYWDVSAQCSRDWDYPIRLLAETETHPELAAALRVWGCGPEELKKNYDLMPAG